MGEIWYSLHTYEISLKHGKKRTGEVRMKAFALSGCLLAVAVIGVAADQLAKNIAIAIFYLD
jgi:hypothetical protein